MKWLVFVKRFQISHQRAFTYRIETVMWIVNGLISPLVSMAFWLKVSESQPNIEMSRSDLITYFLMLTLVDRLTQMWTYEWLSRSIRNGGFSKYLIQPWHYLIEDMASGLAIKILRLSSLAPFLIVLFIWFAQDLRFPSPLAWFWFLLACVLGFMVNWTYQTILALLAFFVVETDGISNMLLVITSIFRGWLIPLIFLPAALQTVAHGLFTRYMVSFPLEIFLGQVQGPSLYLGFLIGTIWVVLLTFTSLILWRSGIKRYSAVGI